MSKYHNIEEVNLVTAALSGDDGAFAELIGRCDLKLRCVLQPYTLGNELDDVLQESYRKAFQSLSSFDVSRSSFITWLSTIAVRTALDHLRSRSVKEETPLVTNESGELMQPQAMVSSPEENLINSQSYEDVVDRIHSLPEMYRRVAEMRFLDELPYEEISLKLSLPLNTVRTRIRRAKVVLSQGKIKGDR